MDPASLDISSTKELCLDDKINESMEKNILTLKPTGHIGESSNKQIMPRAKRSRRGNQNLSDMLDTFVEPLGTVSVKNANDITFEPTIDMMVNDFDDEQTLDEEEVMASLESQDPESEIATLMEEGEMPLEELLSKYGTKCEDFNAKKMDISPIFEKNNSTTFIGSGIIPIEQNLSEQSGVIIIESCDEESTDCKQKCESENSSLSMQELTNVEPTKNQSHLMDLYPENFSSIKSPKEDLNLEKIYGEHDEYDEIDEDDDDIDTEYVRKSIMIGAAFQAIIPTGLSQYGDILPYENEDKLVWEPSQVSEREVEEYLIKIRDTKPLSPEDISTISEVNDESSIKDSNNSHKESDSTIEGNNKNNMKEKCPPPLYKENKNNKNPAVVKDNEQALHLLVQCGYDFREAIRRKRLNALPHSDTMSIWSEGECRNFEEGIHKFGKDFLKIRQHLVRTRTMRELVQFYYLWKKSERRDRNFSNANTVDHMELYLNESSDFNVNTTATETTENVLAALPPFLTRKTNGCPQFSIMTGGNGPPSNSIQVSDTDPGKTSTTSSWLKCAGVSSNS